MILFFFFQAEDGIRDLIVTGVQTCALPIYEIKENILKILSEEINADFKALSFKKSFEFKDEISQRIEEVLNEKIRPAVAMDGGDIQLKSYKDRVVEVMLKGSCAGCPSSTVTLKQGVERMIKHYVPEVNSVTAVNIE